MLDFLMTSRGVSAAPLPVSDGEGAAGDAVAEGGDNLFGLALEALTTDAEAGADAGSASDSEEHGDDAAAIVIDASTQVPVPVQPEIDANTVSILDTGDIVTDNPVALPVADSAAVAPVTPDAVPAMPVANLATSGKPTEAEPLVSGKPASGPLAEPSTFVADMVDSSDVAATPTEATAVPAKETAERIDIASDLSRRMATAATSASADQVVRTTPQAEVGTEGEGAANAPARSPLPLPVDAAPVMADEAAPQPQTSTLPAPYYLRSLGLPAADAGTADTGGFSQGGGAFAFGGGTHGNAPSPVVIKLAGASFASALAGAPADDALPSQTANQIVQSLRMQWSRGTSEAHIRLEPHHFGEMRIAIRVEGGRVQARVEADAPVVREWLQTNHALLKTGLAEQRLSLEQLEIVAPQDSAAPDPRDGQSRQGEQPRQRNPRRRRADSGELFEVVA